MPISISVASSKTKSIAEELREEQKASEERDHCTPLQQSIFCLFFIPRLRAEGHWLRLHKPVISGGGILGQGAQGWEGAEEAVRQFSKGHWLLPLPKPAQ